MELKEEERSYINQSWKEWSRGIRVGGIMLLLIFTVYTIFDPPSFSSDESMAVLLKLIIPIPLIILGLLLITTSFLDIHKGRIEHFSAPFRRVYRKRSTSYYLGKKRIILPLGWDEHFEKGKEYEAYIYTLDKTPFPVPGFLLRCPSLPEEITEKPLNESLEDKEWVKGLSRKMASFSIVFFIILLFLFFLLPKIFLKFGAPKVGTLPLVDFLTEHPQFADGLFDFLSHGGAGIILGLLFLILFLLILPKMILGKIRTGKDFSGELTTCSNWLDEFKVFYRDFVQVMSREPDAAHLTERRKQMEKAREYQGQYKYWKKHLKGTEKREFIAVFKEISKSIRSSAL